MGGRTSAEWLAIFDQADVPASPYNTIGSLIDEQFRGSQGNWPFGAAAAMILMTLVLIVLTIYARAQARGEAK